VKVDVVMVRIRTHVMYGRGLHNIYIHLHCIVFQLLRRDCFSPDAVCLQPHGVRVDAVWGTCSVSTARARSLHELSVGRTASRDRPAPCILLAVAADQLGFFAIACVAVNGRCVRPAARHVKARHQRHRATFNRYPPGHGTDTSTTSTTTPSHLFSRRAPCSLSNPSAPCTYSSDHFCWELGAAAMIGALLEHTSPKTLAVAAIAILCLLKVAQWIDVERKIRSLGGRAPRIRTWLPLGPYLPLALSPPLNLH
jgi:hypothetical protein